MGNQPLRLHLCRRAASRNGLTDALDAVLLQADILKRTQQTNNAADMAEELQSHLDGHTVYPMGFAARLKSWMGGNRAVAGLAGAAIFLVTLFGGSFPDSREDKDPSPFLEQATVQEPAPDPAPDTVEKCSVAKSHAECADAQNS